MEKQADSFEINLNGTVYNVSPRNNGNFEIQNEATKVAEVYVEPGNLCLEWRSVSQLDMTWVNNIGQLICDHNMENSIL